MARYIDCSHIEKDFEEHFNYYRKESEIKGANGTLIDDTMRTAAMIAKYCLDQIKEAPTADVVPKSKVDRLNAVMKDMDEQRAYTINMLGESLEKAKADVAREIFEEIERLPKVVLNPKVNQFGAVTKSSMKGAIVSLSDISDLKKKYIGEQEMKENRCVTCGAIIPEGRQVCDNCESAIDLKPTEEYKKGYNQGVRDFANRIRYRGKTWSINEIEKELLGEDNALE